MAENITAIKNDKEIKPVDYVEKWNSGQIDKEEYQKIVDECLALID